MSLLNKKGVIEAAPSLASRHVLAELIGYALSGQEDNVSIEKLAAAIDIPTSLVEQGLAELYESGVLLIADPGDFSGISGIVITAMRLQGAVTQKRLPWNEQIVSPDLPHVDRVATGVDQQTLCGVRVSAFVTAQQSHEGTLTGWSLLTITHAFGSAAVETVSEKEFEAPSTAWEWYDDYLAGLTYSCRGLAGALDLLAGCTSGQLAATEETLETMIDLGEAAPWSIIPSFDEDGGIVQVECVRPGEDPDNILAGETLLFTRSSPESPAVFAWSPSVESDPDPEPTEDLAPQDAPLGVDDEFDPTVNPDGVRWLVGRKVVTVQDAKEAFGLELADAEKVIDALKARRFIGAYRAKLEGYPVLKDGSVG